MKYYIYMLAFCLLLSVAGTALAQTGGTTIDVPVPFSFGLSGAAIAIDNGSNELVLGPGNVEIVHIGQALFLRVPARAQGGTRLASLSDSENGIVFRNNTMQLPVSSGTKAGTLIATTENLMADGGVYAGLITGLELDTARITTARNGTGFTASAAILLKDLPAGAAYRVSFTDAAALPAEVAADLEAAGLAAVACSPALSVSGGSAAAGDAMGFVAVTLTAGEDWRGRYGEKNLTFYGLSGGRLYRLPFSVPKAPDSGFSYQAMAPGAGQFILVATAPRGPAATEASGADVGVLALLGGILAALLAALVVLVRRVIRR